VIVMLAVALYGGAAVATGASGDGGSAEGGAVVGVSQIGLQYEPAPPRRAASSTGRMIWPVRGAITGQFGEQRGGHEHAGIDIPIADGTPIKAALDGVVVMREWQDGYGNYTCAAHEGGFSTCYAHQSRFRVKQGARVSRGDVIGFVGNTGTSDTPHLHFEVRSGRAPWGAPQDPLKRLPRS
jgi:murein DD-endopeptidase MepM/ murein hydrolase activator NlpD